MTWGVPSTGFLRRAALAAVATLALVGATGARAAATWLQPQTVSGPVVQTPHVAVDAAGDAVAVWTKVESSTYTVMAASRPAGGAWGAPVPIGTPGPEQYKCESCSDPQVGMDATGRAYAVWSWYDSSLGQRKMLIRIRSAAGAWGRFATILSSIPNPTEQRLAVDGRGDVAVVWNVYDGAHTLVQGRFRSDAGTYSPVQTISSPGISAYQPEVAIDGAGNAVATWPEGPGTPATDYIATSFRPAAGPWGAAVPLSTLGGYEHHVAMNATGDALAAWSRVDGSNVTRVEAAFRPAGGAWGAGVPISTPRAGGAFVQDPRIAIGPTGTAFVVWTGYNGTNAIVQSASRNPGAAGTWSALQNLSAPGANASVPQVARHGDRGRGRIVAARAHAHTRAGSRAPGRGSLELAADDLHDRHERIPARGRRRRRWQRRRRLAGERRREQLHSRRGLRRRRPSFRQPDDPCERQGRHASVVLGLAVRRLDGARARPGLVVR